MEYDGCDWDEGLFRLDGKFIVDLMLIVLLVNWIIFHRLQRVSLSLYALYYHWSHGLLSNFTGSSFGRDARQESEGESHPPWSRQHQLISLIQARDLPYALPRPQSPEEGVATCGNSRQWRMPHRADS